MTTEQEPYSYFVLTDTSFKELEEAGEDPIKVIEVLGLTLTEIDFFLSQAQNLNEEELTAALKLRDALVVRKTDDT